MLKNARIEEEGRCHRRRGFGRINCPYTGLDAVDWLRGYEDEKLQEFQSKAFHKVAARPKQAASPFTVSIDQYNRLQLQAKQSALAVLELPATGKHARLKQIARKLLEDGGGDDEATWAAVAARLQPHLKK